MPFESTLLPYSIRVYKEYFNFASSHFLIFPNGQREPLHGHNYRVRVQVDHSHLQNDLVFDFLDIKPVVRDLCQTLDHRLILPGKHPQLRIDTQGPHYKIQPPTGAFLLIPQEDVLILPIENSSAERLAIYLAEELAMSLKNKFSFMGKQIMMEVEETPGQSALYILKGE
jgi:6-pyruvoyl-tetrahydropterin synthase